MKCNICRKYNPSYLLDGLCNVCVSYIDSILHADTLEKAEVVFREAYERRLGEKK